jgi:ParB-like chromosome segregation protein Spo0J
VDAHLKVVRRKLARLKLDPENARLHDERNLAAIKSSLSRFGQVEPIVVQKKTNRVIGGNGRVVVLREMGEVEVDVVELDIGDQRAKELSLLLNRSADLSSWDDDALRAIHEAGGVDLLAAGWTEAELVALLAPSDDEPEVPEPDPIEGHPHTVSFNPEAWATVERAIARLRKQCDDPAMRPNRAIELALADWLA